MRVLAGEFKNKELIFPKTIRPSSQLHKKILFDTIRPYIRSSNFLDLYAGSGQIGIEAISQGANHVTFVDNNFQSCKTIHKNIFNCGITADRFTIAKTHVHKFILKCPKKFDIIYADPPYFEIDWNDFTNITKVMTESSLLIIKFSPKNKPPQFDQLHFRQTKSTTDTSLNFYSI